MQTIQTTGVNTYDILLVDDDVDEHFLFQSSLGEIGLNKRIAFFDSGKRAIRYLNTISRPDLPSLIVSDYFMPDMNGKDLLLYLKCTYRFSRIPVIVYSTQMNENRKDDLMELGAVACFKKTGDPEELRVFLAALAVIYDNRVYR